MGEGTRTRTTDWRQAGEVLRQAKSTDSAGRTLFKPTVHSKNGSEEQTLPLNAICELLYIPGSHPAQWNTPGDVSSDISSCGGIRRRPPRGSTHSGSAHTVSAHTVPAHTRSRCYTATVTSPDSRHHARGQQRQRAPAQPDQRRPQVRRGGQRHSQAAADRKVGSHAHGTLRHQRQRNAGQRPGCRPARAPRHLTLPSPAAGDGSSGGLVRGRRGRGRGGDPPARADGPYRQSAQIAANLLICHSCCHACASSWQPAAVFGVSSY
jgi:hypothetical protein